MANIKFWGCVRFVEVVRKILVSGITVIFSLVIIYIFHMAVITGNRFFWKTLNNMVEIYWTLSTTVYMIRKNSKKNQLWLCINCSLFKR